MAAMAHPTCVHMTCVQTATAFTGVHELPLPEPSSENEEGGEEELLEFELPPFRLCSLENTGRLLQLLPTQEQMSHSLDDLDTTWARPGIRSEATTVWHDEQRAENIYINCLLFCYTQQEFDTIHVHSI